MSAFPTATSRIFYNEDGEVLGWDSVWDDGEGHYSQYDEDRDQYLDGDETQHCRGTKEGEHCCGTGIEGDDAFECDHCGEVYRHED